MPTGKRRCFLKTLRSGGPTVNKTPIYCWQEQNGFILFVQEMYSDRVFQWWGRQCPSDTANTRSSIQQILTKCAIPSTWLLLPRHLTVLQILPSRHPCSVQLFLFIIVEVKSESSCSIINHWLTEESNFSARINPLQYLNLFNFSRCYILLSINRKYLMKGIYEIFMQFPLYSLRFTYSW